jgi:hypothetical protein
VTDEASARTPIANPAIENAIRFRMKDSPLFLCGTVVSRELCIHLVERMTGDAQRGEHLAAGFFAFAMLFGVSPNGSTAKHRRERNGGGQPLPQNEMRVAMRPLRAALLHQLPLQSGRRGPALKCLPQFSLKVFHWFKVHWPAP